MAIGRPHRHFGQPGLHVEGRIFYGLIRSEQRADRHGAVAAGFEIALIAVSEAADDIDVRRQTRSTHQGGEILILVGADFAVSDDAPALANLEDVVGVFGAEGNDTADGAGAEDIRHRSTDDVGIGDHFRIEIEAAVGIVTGALEVLTCAVDHHVDAAEILQAADIDRRRRFVGPLLERNARYAEEDVGRAARHDLFDLFLANSADRGERIDGFFLGLGGQDGDRIEHLFRLRQGRRGNPTL